MFYVALTNTQKSEFRILLTLIPLGWRGWGRVTHYITVGRCVPIKKGFFQSLFGMGIIVSSLKIWKGNETYPSGNRFMPALTGLANFKIERKETKRRQCK